MTQYKIQVGSWTKLPNGKVQEDTRDIMEMMAGKVGGKVEGHTAYRGDSWGSLGVNNKLTIKVYDTDDYKDQGLTNEPSLFTPYEELQKILNTPEGLPTVTSLLNTKLDCRKPDGSVDEDLSRAFQEACFEQGILWCGQYNDIRYLSSPFLFAEPDGCLGYTNIESEKFFNAFTSCKQINFKYSRKLEWEATEIEPEVIEEKTITICGVDYTEEQLDNIFKAIKGKL
jgi:hypothetical protein